MQKQRYSSNEANELKKKRNIKIEGVEDKEVFYSNLKDTVKHTWKNEGPKGFYKG